MIGCHIEWEGFLLTKPYYEKREITDFKDLINQSVKMLSPLKELWENIQE